MRMAIVPSSSVMLENRMDAGFHCMRETLLHTGSLNRARKAVMALIDPSTPKEQMEEAAKAKCIEIMNALPHGVRVRSAKDLMRGSTDHTINIDKAIKEYPFMALAIAFSIEEADLVLKRQAEDMMQRANSIEAIGESIRPPKRNGP